MTFDFPFALEIEDARVRLQALTDYWTHHYGVLVTWSGDHGSVRGKVLKVVMLDASFELRPGAVHVDGKDPGFLLRRQAVDYVKRKLTEYLDASVALDALPRQ